MDVTTGSIMGQNGDLFDLRYRWIAKSVATHKAHMEPEECAACTRCLSILRAILFHSQQTQSNPLNTDRYVEQWAGAYQALDRLVNRAYRRSLGSDLTRRASYHDFTIASPLQTPAANRREDLAP